MKKVLERALVYATMWYLYILQLWCEQKFISPQLDLWRFLALWQILSVWSFLGKIIDKFFKGFSQECENLWRSVEQVFELGYMLIEHPCWQTHDCPV